MIQFPLINDPLFHVCFVELLVTQFFSNMKGKLPLKKMPVKIRNILVPETVEEMAISVVSLMVFGPIKSWKNEWRGFLW